MSNEGGIEERTRLPEYEIDQYFPRQREISDEELQRLRDQFGYVQTFFIRRPDPFRNLQRWLNQARMGVTYDEYLERSTYYAVGAGVAGVVVAVLLTLQLAAMGVLGSLSSPIDVGGGLALFVAENRVLFAGLGLTVVLGGGLAASVWVGRYYWPLHVARDRVRNIDVVLPHAIVYMYALSRSGQTTFEILRETAEAGEVYGEVANEFDMIVRDVELFGNDLFTAIRDARNLTSSDNLEQFLDDMLSVLDSGSDIATFLENESETYMEEARQAQEDFLETLSILSEIFVVAFVAAPLFFIVTLMVLSLLGGETLGPTYLLVYAVLPLGMVGYLLVIDLLSSPYSIDHEQILLEEDREVGDPGPDVRAHERFEEFWKQHRRDRLRDQFRNPVRRAMNQTPLLTLVVTVPVALVVLGLVLVTDTATFAGFGSEPIAATIWLLVLPFLIVAGPLSVFHELKRRRERRIGKRFPDTLNVLSSANEMGIQLPEAIDLVSRWSEGTLAVELRKLHNDIQWNHDIERSLLAFADRLRVPQVTRTMQLVSKGVRSNSDLSNVLHIAAEDTRNRHKLEESRRQSLSAYIAIVLIGFLVYLAVVVMVDVGYLVPISDLASEGTGDLQGPLLDVGSVPVQEYRVTFFHSALIQGLGSGLLAGKLSENDAFSGLKYSIALVLLTLGVFALV